MLICEPDNWLAKRYVKARNERAFNNKDCQGFRMRLMAVYSGYDMECFE